ncbi:hypothetical protein EUTSA_v10013098mg [Eutrema salsugineum]|uniref:Uncharacterized protein n=1 Tax=Eutrema salsugineum TaxID=72664 RepID=V4L9S9_EUTSA|nr:protein ENHANCED DISEASE RESISTANCE 4 [Eutrema salsugineum]ESQ40434.1 hypothetical protein EUTSA_v10013098mg [Eutrema salsugineum]
MASQTGQRVRLVKCPKCLKILQEDEDVPVYQCGGCSAILQAKRRSITPNTTPSAGETEGAQASEPRSNQPETNNVSTSSRQDTVLPSSPGQEEEKPWDGSMESTQKQLGGLDISNREEGNEIQLQASSLGDSDKNEGEDNSSRLKSDIKSETEATRHGTSSGSLNADHVVDARASNSSSDAYHKPEAEISPDASPVEEEQNEDDLPANKTSSAYDGSESSSDEREDQLLNENEQWNALQKIRSGKFETQRYPELYKEQGASSSSTFSETRRNGTHQNRSLQLEGPGGRLGRQGKRHVTEQLRPDLPFYPRDSYTRVSPSYPSHDEFDRYSRAHSLQMPPYAGGMNYENVDYMFHNNTRARGRGQGGRFSGEMVSDRRNHPGWYSAQLHNSYSSYSASPQRPMEQPEYYPRWSHEIVSDVEDHQRNRHAGHHHDLQNRRLNERQRVAKRHIRPTAGGAPFVSCYSCSENLQLPVDFLIFKRKHHLLRCGTCTTVLRFSLQSRTHLIPVVTHDINTNRSRNSTSESPSDKAPSKPVKPSSSAQEEEVPVARGSPLHRLMGYSTVSQVFKASQRPPSV